MRDAACKRADGIELLRLRHLCFERLLLGHLDRIDDGSLFGRLIGLVDDGIHVEAEMPRFVFRIARVDRRNIALPVFGGRQRLLQLRPITFVDDVLKGGTALDIIARDEIREELQERRIRPQNAAVAIDGRDRHRRIVEEAAETHRGGGGRLLGIPAVLPGQDDGAALTGRAVAHRRDTVDDLYGQALAIGPAQIEIERHRLLETRFRLHRLDQRQPLAGDEIAYGHRARYELGQIEAQPFGKRCIEIEDLALASGGKSRLARGRDNRSRSAIP